jgi:MATE family multidrug resistance protein
MSDAVHPQSSGSLTSRVAALTWPILIGQLAVIANGVVDTVMTARYSATDLAALGLGASVYISIFVGLSGVMQALSPTIGQLYGARKFEAIGFEVRQGVWLTLFLSCLGAIALCFPHPLLSIAQAPAELNDKVEQYLRILALALPATLGLRVYASLNTAISRPRRVMAIQLSALLLKIPLNALFIFGGLGLPAFGSPGCAMATAVAAWIALLAGWLLLRHDDFYSQFKIFVGGLGSSWTSTAIQLELNDETGRYEIVQLAKLTEGLRKLLQIVHLQIQATNSDQTKSFRKLLKAIAAQFEFTPDHKGS